LGWLNSCDKHRNEVGGQGQSQKLSDLAFSNQPPLSRKSPTVSKHYQTTVTL
jgi:hypothetical protein